MKKDIYLAVKDGNKYWFENPRYKNYQHFHSWFKDQMRGNMVFIDSYRIVYNNGEIKNRYK